MDIIEYQKEWLSIYEEEGNIILPLSLVDGYGKFEKVQEWLATFPQTEYQTMHHFSEGVYTRVGYVPQGTIITGHPHKQSTVLTIISGAITVITVDELGKADHKGVLRSPDIIVAKPNVKKIGFTHEDTVMSNSFSITDIPEDKRNEENLDMIEEYLFDKRGMVW